MTLRPVIAHAHIHDVAHARAQKIIKEFGITRLAHLGFLPDKRYFFSAGGSLILYRVISRVAITLGDPIGPEDDQLATITAFQTMCRRSDWQPVFYQTLPETQSLYETNGLSTLCIGHEALVDLDSFDLAGGQKKSLRTAVNRLTKSGYSVSVTLPPIPYPLINELQQVSSAWLSTTKGQEKRFSLGWFSPHYLRRTGVINVRRPDGKIVGFLNFVSEPRSHGIAVDLMRRLPETETGVMEFLFVALIDWARTHDFRAVNLGLSPLAKVGEDPGDPTTEKILRFGFENLNQWYNFRGLYFFKEKFDPTWEPRYLIYPRGAALPPIALALIRAHSA